MVFAVYSNLDVLFGDDVETSFFHVDINDKNFDADVDINENNLDNLNAINMTTAENTNRTTCLQLANGTERCTSNDANKPHLTLNSHIISATLRKGATFTAELCFHI